MVDYSWQDELQALQIILKEIDVSPHRWSKIDPLVRMLEVKRLLRAHILYIGRIANDRQQDSH